MESAMEQTQLLSEDQKVKNWQRANLWRVALFYFFQGISFNGLAVYLYATMSRWELPVATQTTVIAIIALPLYIKALPGLLSDRVPWGKWGRRKPYIILGGLLYIPGFAMLIANQQFDIPWICAILLYGTAWMFVDTTLDGLSVDITPKERSAQLQSGATVSNLIATALVSLLVPILGPRIGWTPVLVVLGVAALIQTGMALLLHEIPVTREDLRKQLPLGKVMRGTFTRPLVWLSIFFFLFFTIGGVDRIINIFLLTELGWANSPEMMTIYGVLGMVGTLSAVLGALLVGFMPSRWLTSFRFYVVFLAFQWLLLTPWLLVFRLPDNLVLIFIVRILMGITFTVNGTLIGALTMRVCPKSIEGFTFALMSSVRSFAMNTLGPKTASAFSPQLGLVPSIFTMLPYGLLSLVFLYPMLKRLDKPAEEPLYLVPQPSASSTTATGN